MNADDLDAELGWPIPEEHGVLDDPCPPPADADQANRMMRTVAALRRKITAFDELRDGEIRRVTAWHTRVVGPLARQVEWLEAGIADWARAVHRANEREKTIQLPWGTIPIRARQRRVEVVASQEDLALLRKSHPAWVRETLAPEKNPIKAGVVAGGPLPADDHPDIVVPAGYSAHVAIVPGDSDLGTVNEYVPGVVILEPLPGVDGKTVTVKPDADGGLS